METEAPGCADNCREVYAAFMDIENEADALAFWKANIPDPVGKTYYTPMDYRWATSQARESLMPADWAMNARLFLKPGAKKKRREKFERNTALVIEAAVMNTDALDEWVRSRYNIEPAYLLPLGFTYTRAEAPEEWLNTTDLEQILANEKEDETGEGPGAGKVLYYWREVKPKSVPEYDDWRHVILVDRQTHREAPLLPGVEPYVE